MKKVSINLNDMAMDIASDEGLKKQVDVAQIKEVIRIIFTKFTLAYIVQVWLKYSNDIEKNIVKGR